LSSSERRFDSFLFGETTCEMQRTCSPELDAAVTYDDSPLAGLGPKSAKEVREGLARIEEFPNA
jgi:hypothetical protein